MRGARGPRRGAGRRPTRARRGGAAAAGPARPGVDEARPAGRARAPRRRSWSSSAGPVHAGLGARGGAPRVGPVVAGGGQRDPARPRPAARAGAELDLHARRRAPSARRPGRSGAAPRSTAGRPPARAAAAAAAACVRERPARTASGLGRARRAGARPHAGDGERGGAERQRLASGVAGAGHVDLRNTTGSRKDRFAAAGAGSLPRRVSARRSRGSRRASTMSCAPTS